MIEDDLDDARTKEMTKANWTLQDKLFKPQRLRFLLIARYRSKIFAGNNCQAEVFEENNYHLADFLEKPFKMISQKQSKPLLMTV